MSEARSQLIIDGKFFAYGTRNKKGWYTSSKVDRSYFYRSSWEEAVMQWLDRCPNVVTWEYETLRIPYFYEKEGCQRWYVPDFVIIWNSGLCQVVEVKPKEFVETDRVRLKREAAERWCAVNGASYVTATKQLLIEWGVVV
jgi:hypothetical protein